MQVFLQQESGHIRPFLKFFDSVVQTDNRLDKLGYSTWKELTDKLELDNPRTFVDFFNGKQCISKDVLIKTFEILDIPIELLDLYTEKIVKYKIK